MPVIAAPIAALVKTSPNSGSVKSMCAVSRMVDGGCAITSVKASEYGSVNMKVELVLIYIYMKRKEMREKKNVLEMRKKKNVLKKEREEE